MANTLGDLTKRENRFGHFGFGWQDVPGTTVDRAALSVSVGIDGKELLGQRVCRSDLRLIRNSQARVPRRLRQAYVQSLGS